MTNACKRAIPDGPWYSSDDPWFNFSCTQINWIPTRHHRLMPMYRAIKLDARHLDWDHLAAHTDCQFQAIPMVHRSLATPTESQLLVIPTEFQLLAILTELQPLAIRTMSQRLHMDLRPVDLQSSMDPSPVSWAIGLFHQMTDTNSSHCAWALPMFYNLIRGRWAQKLLSLFFFSGTFN